MLVSRDWGLGTTISGTNMADNSDVHVNVNVNEQIYIDVEKSLDSDCEERRLEGNDSIAAFLLVADLEQFQAAFESEGVIKVDHIQDLAKEDLVKIGDYYYL